MIYWRLKIHNLYNPAKSNSTWNISKGSQTYIFGPEEPPPRQSGFQLVASNMTVRGCTKVGQTSRAQIRRVIDHSQKMFGVVTLYILSHIWLNFTMLPWRRNWLLFGSPLLVNEHGTIMISFPPVYHIRLTFTSLPSKRNRQLFCRPLIKQARTCTFWVNIGPPVCLQLIFLEIQRMEFHLVC